MVSTLKFFEFCRNCFSDEIFGKLRIANVNKQPQFEEMVTANKKLTVFLIFFPSFLFLLIRFMSSGKSWTFTLFNHDEKSIDALKLKTGEVELICFQEEKCPNTDRLHLQGFVKFPSTKRFNAVKIWLGDDAAHLETAKGSPRQNLDYCTKDDSATGKFRYQYGDFNRGGQGKRNDLDAVVERIQAGDTMETINELFPTQVIKFGRGIQLSRSLHLAKLAPSTFPRTVIVLYGRSGSGKSLWARQFAEHNNLSVYSKNLTKASDTQWFDGYDGEQCLILDDFTDQAVSFRELLIWTDIYKHRAQVKGAMSIGTWSHVIITSNISPNLWYQSYVGAEREPLVRRLDHTLQAPPAPYYCDAIYDPHGSYAGRSPPHLGPGAGAGAVQQIPAALPGGGGVGPIPPPSARIEEDDVDPRDEPDFHFTDNVPDSQEMRDFQGQVRAQRQLWDGASPPYYHESD